MKSLFNSIVSNNEQFKKIHFNTILNDKNLILIALDENPIDMIIQIENTYSLQKHFKNQYFLVDDYFFEFIKKMNKKPNQKIINRKDFKKTLQNAIFLNFNKNLDLSDYLTNFNETIFIDINNRGNFVIEPTPESFTQILKIFSDLIDIKTEYWNFTLNVSEKRHKDFEKTKLVFDIQNSANERAVEVLLKNLNQNANTEIYLIWRAGSIDFDYSHIDVDNFLQFYEAITQSDVFFTDDKKIVRLLKKINVKPVYLGKNFDSSIKSFIPKDIFNIKNFVFKDR